MGLKPPTLQDDFEFISKHDDAVDTDAPDFDEVWARYLDGVEDPPLVGGSKPAVFTLKPITSKILRAKLRALAKSGPNGIWPMLIAYAQYGIQSLDNFTPRPEFEFDEDGFKRVSAKWADENMLDEVMAEVGLVVFSKSKQDAIPSQ